MDHDDDRAARQGANLARHLNQSYPDSVLFLARLAGGKPDATAAELVSLTDAELLFQVTTAGAVQPVRVPLPPAADTGDDVRARVRELLRLTRLNSPDAPVTSLEERTGGRSRRHD